MIDGCISTGCFLAWRNLYKKYNTVAKIRKLKVIILNTEKVMDNPPMTNRAFPINQCHFFFPIYIRNPENKKEKIRPVLKKRISNKKMKLATTIIKLR
jgi:hypothetical protein